MIYQDSLVGGLWHFYVFPNHTKGMIGWDDEHFFGWVKTCESVVLTFTINIPPNVSIYTSTMDPSWVIGIWTWYRNKKNESSDDNHNDLMGLVVDGYCYNVPTELVAFGLSKVGSSGRDGGLVVCYFNPRANLNLKPMIPDRWQHQRWFQPL